MYQQQNCQGAWMLIPEFHRTTQMVLLIIATQLKKDRVWHYNVSLCDMACCNKMLERWRPCFTWDASKISWELLCETCRGILKKGCMVLSCEENAWWMLAEASLEVQTNQTTWSFPDGLTYCQQRPANITWPSGRRYIHQSCHHVIVSCF